MITVFGIRNCDTMKKAFAWLEANGVPYEFRDYRQPGVVAAHLPEWNRHAGWQALLNTRGLTWRRLAADERAGIDEERALQLMVAHPTLIRRPVLAVGGQLLVGFSAEIHARLLDASNAAQRAPGGEAVRGSHGA
ncbi:arsenate reductase [Accumulibacter sp.]|uniref:arsenate reductase n=1 Tax=Accumulibacter sp. TaxID=2053492 RepID=UPI0025D39427|nr:arsenate reductase [Accumulibacter sp.]MCM8612361.1 arsenate reductase [Accumulibacter sp.]MCM8636350.1 arsenate reductase [Accumulibacter sp.]MCM8640057.1 arsenate reductase [Accumulibacter sp.]